MINNPEVQNIDARSDDFSAQYLVTRRDANAPSSAAWKGAINAGMDPGDVVLDRPFFDAIETRTDGKKIFKVGVDNDNPENSVVLSVGVETGDSPTFTDLSAILEGGAGDGTPANGGGDDNSVGVSGGGRGGREAEDEVSDRTSPLDVVDDVFIGVAKGVVGGAALAGQEIGDALTGGFWTSVVMPWMHENIPGLVELEDATFPHLEPKGGVQEGVSGIVAPMAQVIMPGALFTKAFRVAGYGRILAETLGYSAAEIVAVAPKDITLIELGLQLIDRDPDNTSAIEKAFAAQESESDFMTRIKNIPRRVLEGGGIGIVTERMFQAVGMAYRFMKNSPAYKRAAGVPLFSAAVPTAATGVAMQEERPPPIPIVQSKIPKNTPAQQKRADSIFGDFRKRLAPREGGYVNRGLQEDPGGPTNKGISQEFLNDLRTNKATRKQWRHLPAQTKNLTNAQIDDILRKEFFDRPQIDRLERVPGLARAGPTLAEQIFDAGVLHGTAVAGKWLQHSLDEVLGTNLKVVNKTTGKHEYDGILGSDTRQKVEQAVRQGKIKEICNKIVDKRLAYMKANPRLKDNRGWIPRAESFRRTEQGPI